MPREALSGSHWKPLAILTELFPGHHRELPTQSIIVVSLIVATFRKICLLVAVCKQFLVK